MIFRAFLFGALSLLYSCELTPAEVAPTEAQQERCSILAGVSAVCVGNVGPVCTAAVCRLTVACYGPDGGATDCPDWGTLPDAN